MGIHEARERIAGTMERIEDEIGDIIRSRDSLLWYWRTKRLQESINEMRRERIAAWVLNRLKRAKSNGD